MPLIIIRPKKFQLFQLKKGSFSNFSSISSFSSWSGHPSCAIVKYSFPAVKALRIKFGISEYASSIVHKKSKFNLANITIYRSLHCDTAIRMQCFRPVDAGIKSKTYVFTQISTAFYGCKLIYKNFHANLAANLLATNLQVLISTKMQKAVQLWLRSCSYALAYHKGRLGRAIWR